MVAFSDAVSFRSFENVPVGASACHGGIDAVGDLLADGARPRAHLLVADERHRRDLARAMTGDAIRVQNRRDVTRECWNAVGGLWRRLDTPVHGGEARGRDEEQAENELRNLCHGCLEERSTIVYAQTTGSVE